MSDLRSPSYPHSVTSLWPGVQPRGHGGLKYIRRHYVIYLAHNCMDTSPWWSSRHAFCSFPVVSWNKHNFFVPFLIYKDGSSALVHTAGPAISQNSRFASPNERHTKAAILTANRRTPACMQQRTDANQSITGSSLVTAHMQYLSLQNTVVVYLLHGVRYTL